MSNNRCLVVAFVGLGGNEEGIGREDQPSGRKRGRKDDKGTDLSDSDHL